MNHIEDEHQKALISWSKYHPIRVDGETVCVHDYLFAIPNGGKRNRKEAGRMKGQGVKAGVSDVFLSLPASTYHGLYIELKRPKVKGQSAPSVSADQKKWIERVRRVNFAAVVAYGVDEARDYIKRYLKGERL